MISPIRSALFLVLFALACRASAPPAASPVVAPPAPAASAGTGPLAERPELDWWRDSMATREQRLGWWREARFGMFVHWGVYSHWAGVWEGEPVAGLRRAHPAHAEDPDARVYREKVVAQFNPTAFDADAWIAAAKRRGHGLLHHHRQAPRRLRHVRLGGERLQRRARPRPGSAIRWRELKEACRRHGLKFGFYYSHAFDWGDPDGRATTGSTRIPAATGCSTAARLVAAGARAAPPGPALRRRQGDPPAAGADRASTTPTSSGSTRPTSCRPRRTCASSQAVREAKPDMVVNGRIVQAMPGGPPARLRRLPLHRRQARPSSPRTTGDWEAIPTTNESYGWHQSDHSHKPPGALHRAAGQGGRPRRQRAAEHGPDGRRTARSPRTWPSSRASAPG